jgi:hypothetical protein
VLSVLDPSAAVWPGFEGGFALPSFVSAIELAALCIRASSPAICTATVEQLRAAGGAIASRSRAWISDSDGNKIELMHLVEDSPERRVAHEAAASA